MSAAIIPFPAGASRDAFVARPPPSAPAGLAAKFTGLSVDEVEFERRCRGMLDADGIKMVDKLCAEMQIVREQMQLLAEGLDLTRFRLRTAMARLVPTRPATPRR